MVRTLKQLTAIFLAVLLPISAQSPLGLPSLSTGGASSGSGGGSSGQYSTASVGYTAGTYYFPAGGGLAANATQANVMTVQGSGGTISNFAVNLPGASGGGTATFTWFGGASGTTAEPVTCAANTGNSFSCSDTTHTFTYAAGDKLSIQMVVTTATVTSQVTMVWGTGQVGPAGATGATGAAGAGYAATSTTSLAIGTGSTSFTTQAGLAYSTGAFVRASSAANGANYMQGLVTSYSGTTLVFNVTETGGSGTHADWNINLVGNTGATGATGPTGPTGPAGANGAGNNALCSDATGSTTTYTCPTPNPTVVSLTGLIISFVPQTTNSGSATVNVAGLGAKSLVQSDCSTALSASALTGGKMYLFSYNGTNFCQSSTSGGGASLPVSAEILASDSSGNGVDWFKATVTSTTLSVAGGRAQFRTKICNNLNVTATLASGTTAVTSSGVGYLYIDNSCALVIQVPSALAITWATTTNITVASVATPSFPDANGEAIALYTITITTNGSTASLSMTPATDDNRSTLRADPTTCGTGILCPSASGLQQFSVDTAYSPPQSNSTNALNSATTTVNVSAATAPSTGQVLTATDSTHATWQAAGGSNTLYVTTGLASTLSATSDTVMFTSGSLPALAAGACMGYEGWFTSNASGATLSAVKVWYGTASGASPSDSLTVTNAAIGGAIGSGSAAAIQVVGRICNKNAVQNAQSITGVVNTQQSSGGFAAGTTSSAQTTSATNLKVSLTTAWSSNANTLFPQSFRVWLEQ